MTTTINASNTGTGGLIQTADASGILALQTAGTTAVTIDASQNTTFAGTATVNTIGSAAATALTIKSAGTTAVTIDTSQNVGIGTTSPTNGKLVITGNSVTTAQGIRLTGDTADARFICESATLGAGILGTFSAHSQLFYTNSTEQARIDTSGNFKFNSGYGSVATAYGCRAWVNFNGTTSSPSTIRGSGNVTSVTKNGTGDFTINFTTALVDTNYAPMITADRGGHAAMGYKPTTIATSSYRFTSVQQQGTALDSEFTSVTIFR
jgi:hypothetical protein